MAWTKVTYDTRRQDQLTVTSDDQGNVQQQSIKTFIAVSDGVGGQPPTYSALTANDGTTAIPTVGAITTVDGQSGFKCTQAIPRRTTESPNVFEVQCTFVRKYNYQPPDTTKWQITIAFKGSKSQQVAYYDKDNKAIVNSAGEPFDPSLMQTIYDEAINVSYNTTSPPDLSSYRGKVNSDSISFDISGISRSYTERQLLLDDGDISTTLTLSDSSTPVWQVNMSFLYRSDGWQDKVLDQGWHQLSSDNKLIPIKGKFGQDLSAPARLDGSGHALAPTADPVYLTFKIETETAMSSLFSGLS